MFQTEIVIFIQSFASDFLTAFFNFFTEIGRSNYTVPLMLIIMFGVSFRVGYILIHLVIWNGLITGFLKEFFALPRPANMDSRVLLLGKDYPNPTTFTGMGAKSFFGKLPQHVVEALRTNPIDSWGFPSGHASNAMALWGGIFMFFKKTGVRIIAVAMIIFIPLSRMYLGRHFLADILGGLLLGFLFVFFFYKFIFQNEKLRIFLFEKAGRIQFDLKTVLLLIYFFIVPLLLLFILEIGPGNPAILLGLNLGFMLLWLRGIPKDTGSVFQRIARVLIAALFYFGISKGLEFCVDTLFASETHFIEFIREFLAALLVIWGSTEVSIRLGLFRR